MRRFLRVLPLLLLILTLRPITTQAAEFRTDSNSVTISKPVQRDTFAASSTVSITAPITGEAYIAGNTVTVNQPISRSAYVVGGTLNITKGAGYNLFAAGTDITLNGVYGNDVYVAATDTVTINKGTVIDGDLWVEGGVLNLNGTIKGTVHLDVDSLNSTALINGSLLGNMNSATFTSGSIGGNFHYTSDADATGLGKVKINGTTTREAQSTTAGTLWDTIKGLLTAMVAALLLGSLLAYRFPGTIHDVLDQVSTGYRRAFLRGLAWFILTPIVIIAVAFTLISWKVALVLGLVYLVTLFAAGSVSSFVVGRWIFNRFFPKRRENIWDYMITGILAIYILGVIPVVGIIFTVAFGVLAFIPSLGALSFFVTNRE